MREALLPSWVMDGAIKPIMIRGTQKLINCPRIYFRVTITFNAAVVKADSELKFKSRPNPIPKATLPRSLNGRLYKNLLFFIKIPPFKTIII